MQITENIKTTSTFKMKKKYKMMLANYTDKNMRNYMKRLFIKAQYLEETTDYVVFNKAQ